MAKRGRTAVSEERKLQRRLNTYDQSLYAILAAAIEGRNIELQFETHAQANAYLHKYYRFRLDVLEFRIQGSPALTGMRATGVDARGEKFDGKRSDAPGPIKLTWHNENGFMNPNLEQQVAQQDMSIQLDAQPPGTLQTKKVDRAEEAVKRWLNSPSVPPAPATGCAHEWDTYNTHCLKCDAPHPDMVKP